MSKPRYPIHVPPEPNWWLTFGQRLRALREATGLGQKELAEVVGVHHTYISKTENGLMPPPALDTILRLAQALHVDTDELVTLGGRTPPDVQELLRQHPFLCQVVRELAHQGKVEDSGRGEEKRSIESFT